MTTALQQALPGASVDNATMVAKFAEQAIIVVDDLDAVQAEDFSIQPWAGICSLADGSLFMYDASDTTSTHDGMTVIVVSGRRYILRTTQTFDGMAASQGDTAPPGSPSLGDTYIIGAAPSGDWAAYGKYIAKWTARGWVYRAPVQGMVFWVADVQTFYHYDASDVWTQGLPVSGIADGSISPIKLQKPLGLLAVEDERAAPPVSVPAAGTAYIVAASATGAFAGEDGNVAYSNGTSYDFIDAFEGAAVYNRDAGEIYAYRSGAWEQLVAQTVLQAFKYINTVNSSADLNTSGITAISSLTMPSVVGGKWRIHVLAYSLRARSDNDGRTADFGFYLDAESSFREVIVNNGGLSSLVNTFATGGGLFFYIDCPDAADHTIRFGGKMDNGYTSNNSEDWDIEWTAELLVPTA